MTKILAEAGTEVALAAPPADPLIGRVLDERYRIVRRLGAGGMGIVYEAKHEVLNTRLAIKVLRQEAAGDEEALERSRREAQAASAIGSEHIVDVRDFGRLEDGSTYVVMELIDGKDLFAIVRQAPIEWARACRVGAQVCDALFAAHEQGIVHRDLKLENVLLTARRGEPDFVKIVDFGIAKVQGSAKITLAGRVVGTPEYMSPEQCAGRSVDHRTDIYALGVMLYEMITGTLPFQDPDLAKLVRMQMLAPPPAPTSVRPDLALPLALEGVILRCLAKEKAARFQTMAEVAAELRALAPDREAPAPIAIVDPRATTSSGRVRAARPRWIIPALAVLAIGAIGAIVAGAGSKDDEEVSVAAPPPPPVIAPEAPREEPRRPAEPAVPPAVEPLGITVESEPAGVPVFDAEGALLGDTPLSLPRPTGDERIALELRAPGHASQPVVLSALSAERVVIRLEPRTPGRRAPPIEAPSAAPARVAPEAPAPPRRRNELRDPWD